MTAGAHLWAIGYDDMKRADQVQDEIARLDAVSELPSEYPGWMFARQGGSRAPAPFKAKA